LRIKKFISSFFSGDSPAKPPLPFPLVAGAFLLLVAAFFYQGLLHPRMFIGGPDTKLFYAFKYYWMESLLRGDPAFWCPYHYLGVPLAAHPSTGTFSPFNLLFLVFDYPFAFTLQYILHFWLCACGTYLFLRSLSCGWLGGVLAALSYTFCCFFVSKIFWGQHAMIWAGAWLPWMLYFLTRALKENRLWLLALASACAVLCFFEGYPQIMLYSFLAAAFYLLWLAVTRQIPFARIFWAGFGMMLIFLLLSACQFLPTFEFSRLSNRSLWGYREVMCEYLAPVNFLFFFRPDFQGRLEDYSWHGRWGYFEAVNYVGLAPVLLFLAGVIFIRRIRHYGFFLSLAVLFSLLSMGDSTWFSKALYKFFYHTVPGFGLQRSIGRMMMVASFAVACGAGLALDLLSRTRVTFARIRGVRWMPWALALLLAATMVDLWKFGQRYVKLVDPSYYKAASPRLFSESMVASLLSDPNYPRFKPVEIENRNLFYKLGQLYSDDQFFPAGDQILNSDSRLYVHSILNTQVADLVGLKYAVPDKQPLSPERWEEVERGVYLNKRAYPRVFLVGDYQLENWDWDADWERIYGLLASNRLDLRSILLLKEKPGLKAGLRPGIAGEAEIISYSNNRVEMRCNADRPCFLFLSDNYFPHWEARVDGREVPLFRSDMAFRAVPIEKAGNHSVTMVYRPVRLYWGLLISIFSWLGLAGLMLKGRKLSFMPPVSWGALVKNVAGLKN
jgi:hypothetical protein